MSEEDVELTSVFANNNRLKNGSQVQPLEEGQGEDEMEMAQKTC
jgi:hypothetical protein